MRDSEVGKRKFQNQFIILRALFASICQPCLADFHLRDEMRVRSQTGAVESIHSRR
jgi:hypothetical protein